MIATLWLERPEKRNALRLADVDDLRHRLEASLADARVEAVIIAGRGPSFCGGVDVAEFAGATPESAMTLITSLKELCAVAREAPKPVACAIQGHCVGGALELAVACDFRVCTEDARFSMPEVGLGIPSVIDAALLERYLGLGRAREMLLTGEPMDAREALARGLVNRVVGAKSLLSECETLLGLVTRHPAQAIRAQKRLFDEWLNLPFDEAVESSTEALATAFTSGLPQRIARGRLGR